MTGDPSGWDAVHLFVPAVYPNDGIGGHVERTAAAERSRGRRSEIFVQLVHPETAHLCHHIDQLDDFVDPGERTVFVYQTGTGSTIPDYLSRRSEPLVVQHQGITPIELMAPWSLDAVVELTAARRQLKAMADRADLGLGTSRHNAAELLELGFRRTAVAPVMLRPEMQDSSGEAKPIGEPPTVLFVGRITPNKCQHDIISAFAVLALRSPGARLRLVGSTATESYRRALDKLVDSLGLGERVTFVGRVTDEELADEYREADVFCSMSEHEGFGVPLLEAAHHSLPVVAYDTTAVGETIGAAGLLLDNKEPAAVATALDRVLSDPSLRSSMVIAGHRRLGELSPERIMDSFDGALAQLATDLSSEPDRSTR